MVLFLFFELKKHKLLVIIKSQNHFLWNLKSVVGNW
jgi:hypothetical protein